MLNVIQTASQLILDGELMNKLDEGQALALVLDQEQFEMLLRVVSHHTASIKHRELFHDMLQIQRNAGWAADTSEGRT